ncbi:hypothetical protein BpHYR1_028960 [Brachionus plicatilis]|uniref:Uncharacterized protein n=1 Tax=Brachionus plicatilis TaxID=10195 RepID=A0A3M7SFX8_BRAPC|nr:hypothetical protein BpHYR1_028960 [Brachionus plicatilis]
MKTSILFVLIALLPNIPSKVNITLIVILILMKNFAYRIPHFEVIFLETPQKIPLNLKEKERKPRSHVFEPILVMIKLKMFRQSLVQLECMLSPSFQPLDSLIEKRKKMINLINIKIKT